MSKLDQMVEAEIANIVTAARSESVTAHLAAECMARFMQSDPAFHAMCEERLERLEASTCTGSARSVCVQIAALRTLLEGL